MARKLIERIASSRTVLIIISCLASIILWLYVESVENIDADRTITGIPLNYLGEADILADRQLIVMNKDAQTVDLTLYGNIAGILYIPGIFPCRLFISVIDVLFPVPFRAFIDIGERR